MRKELEYYEGIGKFNGLFKFARVHDLYQNIVVISQDYAPGTPLYTSEYYGSHAKSVIDGSFETCWCNNAYHESHAVFYIDLFYGKFQLNTFAFRSVCDIPRTLQVKGSDDNLTFVTLCNVTDIVEDHQESIHQCFQGNKAYRYFEVRQVGLNRYEQYRLHVSEIEFFGIFDYKVKTVPLISYIQIELITKVSLLFLYSDIS